MALKFSIQLEDQVSPAAIGAANSLQKLEGAIKQESASLAKLEGMMRNLQRASTVDIDTSRKLAAAISYQKDKIGLLTEAMIHSVPATEKVKGSSAALESLLGSLAGESGVAGRALASMGTTGLVAAGALGAIAIGGAAAIATLVGVAGAVVYLESKLISLGIKASEAKAGVTSSLELLYGSQKAAEHTYKVLEAITGSIAISQDRVFELADTLIKAGQVNGDAMVRSIETIGKAEAARAGAGKVLEGVITRATSSRMFSVSRQELMQVGISYRELSKEVAKGIGTTVGEAELRLRTGGVRVKEGLEALNRVVDAKMGDLAMRKFETVSHQTQRLKDGFSRLFEGVDGTPFARVLMVIANALDESTVTGQAMRTVIKSAFEEISQATEYALPYLQDFFETGILIALKFYNALYPVRQSLKKLFGGGDEKTLESFQDKTLAFAEGVGRGFDVAARGMAFMIDNASKLAKAIDALITVTPLIGPAFAAAKGTLDLLTTKGAAKDKTVQSGVNVADGVAQGIQQGTPVVERAMQDMAGKGIKAFDEKMQIKSPSKVMQLRGLYTVQGFAKGANDNAQQAGDAMASAADKITVSAKPSGGGGGRGDVQVTVHFHAGAIQAGGERTVAQVKDELTEVFADILEKAAKMQGAA